jgi:hypothetical protein
MPDGAAVATDADEVITTTAIGSGGISAVNHERTRVAILDHDSVQLVDLASGDVLYRATGISLVFRGASLSDRFTQADGADHDRLGFFVTSQLHESELHALGLDPLTGASRVRWVAWDGRQIAEVLVSGQEPRIAVAKGGESAFVTDTSVERSFRLDKDGNVRPQEAPAYLAPDLSGALTPTLDDGLVVTTFGATGAEATSRRVALGRRALSFTGTPRGPRDLVDGGYQMPFVPMVAGKAVFRTPLLPVSDPKAGYEMGLFVVDPATGATVFGPTGRLAGIGAIAVWDEKLYYAEELPAGAKGHRLMRWTPATGDVEELVRGTTQPSFVGPTSDGKYLLFEGGQGERGPAWRSYLAAVPVQAGAAAITLGVSTREDGCGYGFGRMACVTTGANGDEVTVTELETGRSSAYPLPSVGSSISTSPGTRGIGDRTHVWPASPDRIFASTESGFFELVTSGAAKAIPLEQSLTRAPEIKSWLVAAGGLVYTTGDEQVPFAPRVPTEVRYMPFE